MHKQCGSGRHMRHGGEAAQPQSVTLYIAGQQATANSEGPAIIHNMPQDIKTDLEEASPIGLSVCFFKFETQKHLSRRIH